MAQTRLRLASATAVVYLAIVLGGTLIQFALTGSAFTLRFSLTQPATWLAAGIAAIVAWGLWRQHKWAWWLGMAAAGYQLFQVGSWIAGHFSLSRPAIGPLLVAALLLAFLVLLFPSKVRGSCNR